MPPAPLCMTSGNGNFQFTIMGSELCIIALPSDVIPRATWWIIRRYLLNPFHFETDAFTSLLMVRFYSCYI